MPVLGAAARERVAAQWQRENQEPCGFTKPALKAAIDAADDWFEANTASFVAALPAAFRTASTASQKAAVFAFVLWRRIGRLSTEEDR